MLNVILNAISHMGCSILLLLTSSLFAIAEFLCLLQLSRVQVTDVPVEWDSDGNNVCEGRVRIEWKFCGNGCK